MLEKREAGVLLHVSSLPGKEGIGTLGKEAYAFADWLHETGFSVWQVLPMCHTGFAQSPYLALSAFAGNPLFIDLQTAQEKYNTKSLFKAEVSSGQVDFAKVQPSKMNSLRKLFTYVEEAISEDSVFLSFCENESYWLDPYSLFASVKEKYNDVSIDELPDDFRSRETETLKTLEASLKKDILFYKFLQYEFFNQWKAFKEYVHSKGIRILGDLPIYVAYDSCDVWLNRELFSVDSELNLTEVAGVPPDYFSEKGQLWGNPVYRWEKHREQQYKWWKQRMKKSLEMYDMIRIDHFRGLVEYWSIPAGSENAVNGKWVKGPGMELFDNIISIEERERIIAEDLGVASEDAVKLLDDLGLPGMKVLQFAFDEGAGNTHRPHFFEKNSVVYTGTHDNDTLAGWLESLTDDEKEKVYEYTDSTVENVIDAMIRAAISSVAALCILPMQDILGLGTSARMNVPGTFEGDWLWRMENNYEKHERVDAVKSMIKIYERKQ